MIHTHLLLTPVPSPQTVPLFWVLAGMMRGCHCDQRCRRRTRGCNRGNGVSAPSIPPYPAPGFITVRILPSPRLFCAPGPRLCSRLLPFASVAFRSRCNREKIAEIVDPGHPTQSRPACQLIHSPIPPTPYPPLATTSTPALQHHSLAPITTRRVSVASRSRSNRENTARLIDSTPHRIATCLLPHPLPLPSHSLSASYDDVHPSVTTPPPRSNHDASHLCRIPELLQP